MKILFVTYSLGGGGAERVLSILTDYFVEKLEYEVIVATYEFEGDDFYKLNKKVKRIRFGIKNTNNIFRKIVNKIIGISRIRKIVNSTNPDVVIPLIFHTNLMVIFATIGKKVPVVAVEHSNYWSIESTFYKALRIILYRLSSKVVLLTKKDKLKYDEYLNNCDVISNPILLEGGEEEGAREKILLCVGRLDKAKQFDHIIFIFSHIVKKHPDWTLVIAGSGEELDWLREYTNQLGIKERVKFTGNVSDISPLYKNSGIFVLCSSSEGFPMALGEAMFFGMPVVSYDCLTGPSEMIEDQVSGLLIEDSNKKELENALLSLINNEEHRTFLGNNAKKRIQEFSIQKIGEKWKLLIESTVDKK